MPYPSCYVGHYPNLAKWLLGQGHVVYPMEMYCQARLVVKTKKLIIGDLQKGEYNQSQNLYGKVDVVSLFDHLLWAWEYKSERDSLKRGLLQLTNYARSFDYVCLASVKMPLAFRLLEKFEDLGAGMYAETDDKGFRLVNEPRKQKPKETWRNELLTRFLKNVYSREFAKVQRRNKRLEAIPTELELILREVRRRQLSDSQVTLLSEY